MNRYTHVLEEIKRLKNENEAALADDLQAIKDLRDTLREARNKLEQVISFATRRTR